MTADPDLDRAAKAVFHYLDADDNWNALDEEAREAYRQLVCISVAHWFEQHQMHPDHVIELYDAANRFARHVDPAIISGPARNNVIAHYTCYLGEVRRLVGAIGKLNTFRAKFSD